MQLQCVIPKENFRQLRRASKCVRSVAAAGGQLLSLGMIPRALLANPLHIVYDTHKDSHTIMSRGGKTWGGLCGSVQPAK